MDKSTKSCDCVKCPRKKRLRAGLRWTCRSRGVRWVSESPLVRNATEMGVLVRSKAIDQFIIPIMRATARLLLASLLLVGLLRVVRYTIYALIRIRHPYGYQFLESAMVHLAWRAQHGVTLYPDWESYPHVANFYAPLSFLVTGLSGRALNTDIRGLYLVGRVVSVVSVLATTVVLGLVLQRRYGKLAALFGMVLSLGACPLFAAGVMTRPDALAEFLGLTGFFLAEGRRRRTGIAAGLMLYLAAMTKQTALVYVAAAAFSRHQEGQDRRALILLAGVTSALLVTVATVQWLFEPNFVRCLLGESRTPLRFQSWWNTVRIVATTDPEIFVLTAAGLVLWTSGRKTERGLTALALIVLSAALFTVAKCGSGPNYFLGVSSVAALAGGALWFEMTDPNSRPTVWQILAVVAAGGGLLLSTDAVSAYIREARFDANLLTNTELRVFFDRLYRTAESSNGRILTDEGTIDIRQGERTAFADPYRFKLMVEEGQIDPRWVLERISDQYYNSIITTTDMFSDDYLKYDQGLPGPLVREARRRYQPRGEFFGLFFYERRVGPISR